MLNIDITKPDEKEDTSMATWGAAAASAASGIISAYGQHKANKQNREMAREQMAFQEKMSNSQYQRAVDDMRKAGLNPALAYQQGGAGTPSGALSKNENVLSSALEARRVYREFQAMDSQINLNKAQVGTQNSLAEMYHANAMGQVMDNEITNARIPGLKARAEADLKHAEMDRNWAGYDQAVKRTGATISTAKDAVNFKKPKTNHEHNDYGTKNTIIYK